MKILLTFQHGLGDGLQFQIVINHLKHYHPDWDICVETNPGQASILNCRAYDRIYPCFWHDERWDIRQTVKFKRNLVNHPTLLSTKPTKCIVEEFQLTPLPELYTYQIQPSNKAIEYAQRWWQEELDNQPYVFIHTFGSNKGFRNLQDDETEAIIAACCRLGLRPVILDLPYNDTHDYVLTDRHPWLFDKQRWAQGDLLYEIINNAEYFIGIDSGLAHIASATQTEGIVFWADTPTMYNFHPTNNLTHLIPDDAYFLLDKHNRDESWGRFHQIYNTKIYGASMENLTNFITDRFPDLQKLEDITK